ncbi:hypothetical protein HELRODRAFT_165334 [Helobdella robusta]|uniref:Uncharacterized protein n=1 Tax=Helobdella robusta TaxID=6412 RepID=T1EWL7_HELRO|nr:hypothetical protein HELRODRAFT_165334 [Helobdella robusta]ESN91320.1 hypothetical protein HELRODRAFT_165334 [Helobdella robusta]
MFKLAESLTLSQNANEYDILIEEGQQENANTQDVRATVKTSHGGNKEVKIKMQPATYKIKLPKKFEDYPKKTAVIISVLHLIIGSISLAIFIFNRTSLRGIKMSSKYLDYYMLFGNELWSGIAAIAFAITNINSALLSFYSFAFIVKDIHFVAVSDRWDYIDSPKYIRGIVIVNSVIAIMLLFEFVVALSGSVIFNKIICKEAQKTIEVEIEDSDVQN